jgi:hypothetical protein
MLTCPKFGILKTPLFSGIILKAINENRVGFLGLLSVNERYTRSIILAIRGNFFYTWLKNGSIEILRNKGIYSFGSS